MITKKVFLASSAELKEDRRDFEVFINRKNKDWVARGVFLELVIWEDFFDAVSQTRLQDEYNRAIRDCDIFVMLFATKVGRFTQEEFETAFGQFKETNRPFIFTYFKDAPLSTGSADRADLTSLWAFQDRLKALGHFYTRYQGVADLSLHFSGQLDKLAANGFITFAPDQAAAAGTGGNGNQVTQRGSGAVAQGPGATAAGERGFIVSGPNSADINTGTRIDTGGGSYNAGTISVVNGDFIGRGRITKKGE